MKTASSIRGIDLFSKVQYSFQLLKVRLDSDSEGQTLIPWSDIREYEYFLAKYDPGGSSKIQEHDVLEVGFGARPWRLFAMTSLGINIAGIDLDRPTYGCNPSRLIQVLKTNGFERFVKSFVRGVLFDLNDLRKLRKELNLVGKSLLIDETKMEVGNAAESFHFKPESFSFAFSEDVFEHIPPDVLPSVLANLKTWLKKDAICVIRPHIYTGITGGHDPAYYAYRVETHSIREDRAWAHLWDPEFKVNTYLNKLRLRDYYKLFSEHFDILEVKQKYHQLGKEYLNDSVLQKLNGEYSEEELLTNQVAFVLRA
jgi:hypothetical protein